MDGNIAPNIGSIDDTVLKNFYDHFIKDNYLFSDIQDLFVDGSVIVQMLESISVINTVNNNINIINIISRPHINNISKAPDIKTAGKELSAIYNRIGDGTSLKNTIDKIIKKFNILSFVESTVANILENTRLFIPSGWVSKNGSHLIGFYFDKIGDDDYTIVITNSGAGHELHKKITIGDEVLYQIICEKKNITHKQLQSILNIVIMGKLLNTQINDKIENIDETENVDEMKKRVLDIGKKIDDLVDEYELCDIDSVHDFYSNFVSIFNVENFDEIDFTNDNSFYGLPQLSGSCTYYGVFYFLYYVAQKKK